MSRYIRPHIQGATYFFTLVSFERRKIFCETDFLLAFKESIKKTQAQHPFDILAWVQLPDHLHGIWKMPDDEGNLGVRWSSIKRLTTKACPHYHLPIEQLSASKVRRNEKGIFQRRFYEHQIKDDADFVKHMDYLHYNPVKHGLVSNVQDWQYSSFHRYVKQGTYRIEWGDDVGFIAKSADKFG